MAELVPQDDIVEFGGDGLYVGRHVDDAGARLKLGAAEGRVVVAGRPGHTVAEESASAAAANRLNLAERNVQDDGLRQERAARVLGRRQAWLHDPTEIISLALRLHGNGGFRSQKQAQRDEQAMHVRTPSKNALNAAREETGGGNTVTLLAAF
jgi:hypothetical protein